MAKSPFSAAALPDNRAGRLTTEQIGNLRTDAGKSRRSGLLAGLAITAFGLVIIWGALAGRIPGSKLKPLALGAVFVIGGGLWLRSGGMTRGPRAEQAASESTVLDLVEGAFRRERVDSMNLGGHNNARTGDARYNYYLYVGARQIRVGEAVYDASPDDGLVRVYVLPDSDVVVNLERLSNAPPTALEARAMDIVRERFGAIPAGEHTFAEKRGPAAAAELQAALLGRWQAQGMPMGFEFRADGTVVAGATGAEEVQRWEVLDGERIQIAGGEQRVEVNGDELLLATDGPTFRLHRVKN
jgi:hypothetical protein